MRRFLSIYFDLLLVVAKLLTATSSAETTTSQTDFSAIMTTAMVGNGTGMEEDDDDDFNLGLVIGLGVASVVGAVALAVVISGLVLWLHQRRDGKPTSKEQGRPRQSIAFHQAVRAVRPASLAMYYDSKYHLAPVKNGCRPHPIDKQGPSLYCSSSGCYSPRCTYQGIAVSRSFY